MYIAVHCLLTLLACCSYLSPYILTCIRTNLEAYKQTNKQKYIYTYTYIHTYIKSCYTSTKYHTDRSGWVWCGGIWRWDYLVLGCLPVIQEGGSVTLPFPPGQVSRSPATLHPSPRRSRERRTMTYRQHTDTQADRHGEIGDREKATYIYTWWYIHMIAYRIISTRCTPYYTIHN